MDKSKALLDFMAPGIGANKLLTLAGNVVENMTDNKNFLKQQEQTKVVGVSLVDYRTKWGVAKTGNNSQKALAKTAKKMLQTDMKTLVNGCNNDANGDRAKLLTTGFSVSKESSSKQVLEAISGLVVKPGVNGGDIIVQFNAQSAIQGTGVDYALTATPTPETVWRTVPNGKKASITLSGLVPGTILTIRVWATGPRSQRVVSQSVVTVVGFNQIGKKSRSKSVRTAA